MQARHLLIPMALVAVILSMTVSGDRPVPLVFTGDFGFDAGTVLMPDGGNLYMSLEPGTFHRYEGTDDLGRFMEVEHTVLDEIRTMLFQLDGAWMVAIARVIEEREWLDGQLSELTLNLYARDPNSNNIYYMGEEVTHYEGGQVTDHDGSWIAGEKGAAPGLFMPATYLVGARYCQEMAPGVAMDRAEHTQMKLTIDVPIGIFDDVIEVIETTPIEPDEEAVKYYAPRIGLIADEFLELVEYVIP